MQAKVDKETSGHPVEEMLGVWKGAEATVSKKQHVKVWTEFVWLTPYH
jgi:hypothetical protein